MDCNKKETKRRGWGKSEVTISATPPSIAKGKGGGVGRGGVVASKVGVVNPGGYQGQILDARQTLSGGKAQNCVKV